MLRRDFLKRGIGLMVFVIPVPKLLANSFMSQRPEFVCTRCGKCCEILVEEIFWVGGTLTWPQKNSQELDEKGEPTGVIHARKKYPPAEHGCAMQYYNDDGLATCIIYEKYGPEKRDKNCCDYPGAELCMQEEIAAGKRESGFPYKYKAKK